MRKSFYIKLLSFGLLILSSAAFADETLIEKGAYLSIAGDCAACHTTNSDKPYAGGLPFKMPMGEIITSNITPSKLYGIGNWSQEDFAKAVRKGVRPDGSHLYPAMPYPDYAIVTDDDIAALYAYFMSQNAIDEAPSSITKLDFPFNMPGAMAFWNMLYANAKPFSPSSELNDQQNRGKYLVEGLSHCTTCHTPRNSMLAYDTDNFLAGAVVNSWKAPNITSDPISGIGGWTDEELFNLLKNGHAKNKAQVAGPMAEAVSKSFRFMTDNDIKSIVSYLKIVPAIRNQGEITPSYSIVTAKPLDLTKMENDETALSSSTQYTDLNVTDGAKLYDYNCAACHGINGKGSDDGYIPSLTQNTTVGRIDPRNLVMAITNGIHRNINNNDDIIMPSFIESDDLIHTFLSNEQIAAIVNHVNSQFGQGSNHLTGTDIIRIQQGETPPFLIKHATILTIIGMLIGVLILLLLIKFIFFRKRV